MHCRTGQGGIAEALSLTEEFVKEDSVLAILGDNIIMDDIRPYIGDFRSGARIFLKEVPDPNRFGVPVFDNQKRIVYHWPVIDRKQVLICYICQWI